MHRDLSPLLVGDALGAEHGFPVGEVRGQAPCEAIQSFVGVLLPDPMDHEDGGVCSRTLGHINPVAGDRMSVLASAPNSPHVAPATTRRAAPLENAHDEC